MEIDEILALANEAFQKTSEEYSNLVITRKGREAMIRMFVKGWGEGQIILMKELIERGKNEM